MDQTQKTFKNYTQNSESISITRGDFLIRNLGNIEIDVKCRTFYKDQAGQYFYFKRSDLEKHSNMQLFTKTPVVITVYEKEKNGDKPINNIVYFFSIDDINKLKEKLEITNVKAENTGECYKVPINKGSQDFNFLKDLFKKM